MHVIYYGYIVPEEPEKALIPECLDLHKGVAEVVPRPTHLQAGLDDVEAVQ